MSKINDAGWSVKELSQSCANWIGGDRSGKYQNILLVDWEGLGLH